MKIITILLISLTAMGFAPSVGSAAQHEGLTHTAQQAAGAGLLTGTVGTIRSDRTHATILLRISGGKIVDLVVHPSKGISTRDGRSLGIQDVRLADHLSVATNGHITDESQQVKTLHGIVSLSPLAIGDPIVVQINHSLSVLVDSSRRTAYADRTGETSSLGQVEDGDVVQIRGVFDSTLGELTQTSRISRTGPTRSRIH